MYPRGLHLWYVVRGIIEQKLTINFAESHIQSMFYNIMFYYVLAMLFFGKKII